MKVQVEIGRLVVHDRSMSRRERIALPDQVGRELRRLIQARATVAQHGGRPAPVAARIAAAVAAQLPAQPAGPQR